jgi:hypothetical protein
MLLSNSRRHSWSTVPAALSLSFLQARPERNGPSIPGGGPTRWRGGGGYIDTYGAGFWAAREACAPRSAPDCRSVCHARGTTQHGASMVDTTQKVNATLDRRRGASMVDTTQQVNATLDRRTGASMVDTTQKVNATLDRRRS